MVERSEAERHILTKYKGSHEQCDRKIRPNKSLSDKKPPDNQAVFL
jgi:hypothetical protein